MQLTDGIWLVGSGQYGSQLSHRLDCSLYLIRTSEGYLLIDAGSGCEPERIAANIESAGVHMREISGLLLTHVHGDHAAGAAFFHRQYGIPVSCAAEAAPWLEAGDRVATSLDAAVRAGVYPKDFVFSPCPVERHLGEGEVIETGEGRIHVLETPGHARGHLSFLLEAGGARSLFAGDAVFAGGRIVLQNTWDCSIQDYARTMEKLHRLRIDRLFAGHGTMILSEAWRHVEQAHACFERLGIPPNL